MWYGCVVTVAYSYNDYCLKAPALSCYLPQAFVGRRRWNVYSTDSICNFVRSHTLLDAIYLTSWRYGLSFFVDRNPISWLLYTGKKQWNCGFRKSKGWLHPLYTGDHYMQVNLTIDIRGDFWEVTQWPLYTGWPLYIGSLYTGLTVSSKTFPCIFWAGLHFVSEKTKTKYWSMHNKCKNPPPEHLQAGALSTQLPELTESKVI